MEFEDRLVQKLKEFNIEQLQRPYKNYHGSEGQIYGCVYKSQNGLEQQRILKILQYQDEQQIQKELKVYNTLNEEFNNNENLVTIIKVIHLKDLKSVCILMDECETNLKDYQNNITSLKSRIVFFQQILKGYKSLYNLKVIHRDIKPENILINFQNKKPIYKLTDFGVSKLCEQIYNIQSQLGTPIYAAPELQLIEGQNNIKYDYEKLSKVDVYSLGLILYELQFKKLPFEKYKRQKEFQALPLKDRLNNLGNIDYEEQWFVNLIMYMIENNPNERVEFKELYECYHDKLDIFIQRCKILAEKFTLSQVYNNQKKVQMSEDNSYIQPFDHNNQYQYYTEQSLNQQLNLQTQIPSFNNQQNNITNNNQSIIQESMIEPKIQKPK